MRRFVRIVLYVGLALLVLLVLLAFGLLFVSETKVGRAQVARVASNLTSDALVGSFRIDRIDGSLLSDFTIHDVTLMDDSGADVARVDAIRIDYELAALLSGNVHVEALEITKPWARLETDGEGRTNFEKLVPPSETPRSDSPPPELRIDVDRLTITEGAFAMGPANDPQAIVDGIQLDASAHAPLPQVDATIETLSAHLVENDVRANLKSIVRWADDRITVSATSIDVGDGPIITIPSAFFDTASTRASAQIAVDIPETLPRKFAQLDELSAAFAGTATIAHAGPTAMWTVNLGGRLNGAPLRLAGSVPANFERLDARLTADEVDPAKILRGAPSSNIDIRLSANGPLDDFTATTTVSIGDLRISSVLVPGAQVVATARGLPTAIRGRAELIANNVTAGDRTLGNVRFEVEARDAASAFLIDGTVTGGGAIEIPRLRANIDTGDGVLATVETIAIVTRAVRWRGEGMRVHLRPDDTVHIDDVRLESSAGHLSAQGVIDTTDPLRRSRHVNVTVRDLELDAFSQIVPGAPKMSGKVGAVVTLDRENADAAVQGESLSIGKIAPLAIDATARLRGRVLTATVSADGQVLGRAGLRISGTTPADPTDIDAWRRRALRALSRLDANLTNVELSEVGEIFGVRMLRAGVVNGTVRAGLGAREVEADVNVRRVLLGRSKEAVDGDLTLVADAKRTEGAMTVNVGRARIVTATIEGDVAVAAVEGRGLDALRGANARVDVEVARLEVGTILDFVETATTIPAIEGALSGDVHFTKSGPDVRGHIELEADEVRPHQTAPRFDGRMRLFVEPKRSDLRAWIESAEGIDASAHAVVTTPEDVLAIDSWTSLGLDALESATASVARTKLGLVGALLGVELPAGTASLRLATGPKLSSPFVFLDLRKLEVSAATADFGAALTLNEERQGVAAELGLFANDRPFIGGKVRMNRTVRQLAELSFEKIRGLPIEGSFSSPSFDVKNFFARRKLRQRFSGALRTQLEIAGSIDEPRADLQVSLDEAELGGRHYEALEASTTLEGGAVEAKAHVIQDSGGRLDARARVTKNIDAEIVAEAFAFDAILELMQILVGTPFGAERGRIDARVTARGPRGAPDVDGTIDLEANRLEPGPGVPALEQTKLNARIADGHATLALRGQAGEGTVELDLNATVSPIDALAFDATLKAEDTRIAAGPVAAIVSLDINAQGRRQGDVLNVDVVSNDGFVRLPGDPGGQSLHPVGGMEDVVFVDAAGRAAARRRRRAKESGPSLVTNVRLRTNGALRIEGEDVRTSVTAKVDARTTADGPAISGTVSLPSGTLKVVSHEYKVERANVILDGQVPPDPRLDVVLFKEFDNAMFKVIVTGTAKNPQLTFTADPPVYTRGELMQIFLGGEPGEEGGGELDGKAISAAAGLILGPIAKAARRALPIDTIDIDVGDGSDPKNTAALTLGKWVTRDLFLAYTFRLANAIQEDSSMEGLLRYRFTGAWELELRYAQSQDGSAEILWVKRF